MINPEENNESKHSLLNRTFARRIGKSLSPLKRAELQIDLPQYKFDPKLLKSESRNIFLEVGFGCGEHLLDQIVNNPTSLFIGAEVYLNGVVHFIRNAQELALENFLIWPDDLDLILENIPDNSLSGIYILFPDPWHKRRYLKKRLFNQERLMTFKQKLCQSGFIAFASDIDDYFADAKKLFKADQDFLIENSDSSVAHKGYIETKYHKKAIKENRVPQFICARMK